MWLAILALRCFSFSSAACAATLLHPGLGNIDGDGAGRAAAAPQPGDATVHHSLERAAQEPLMVETVHDARSAQQNVESVMTSQSHAAYARLVVKKDSNIRAIKETPIEAHLQHVVAVVSDSGDISTEPNLKLSLHKAQLKRDRRSTDRSGKLGSGTAENKYIYLAPPVHDDQTGLRNIGNPTKSTTPALYAAPDVKKDANIIESEETTKQSQIEHGVAVVSDSGEVFMEPILKSAVHDKLMRRVRDTAENAQIISAPPVLNSRFASRSFVPATSAKSRSVYASPVEEKGALRYANTGAAQWLESAHANGIRSALDPSMQRNAEAARQRRGTSHSEVGAHAHHGTEFRLAAHQVHMEIGGPKGQLLHAASDTSHLALAADHLKTLRSGYTYPWWAYVLGAAAILAVSVGVFVVFHLVVGGREQRYEG